MKAITIHQPWASAVAFGLKRFETRPRKTNHRGPIAIHAGKTLNEEALSEMLYLPWQDHIQLPVSRMWSPISGQDFPQGAIIAVAELSECLEMDEALIEAQSPHERAMGHWESGRYAYQLDNVKPITPIPIGGKQGLWNWDEEGYDG